MNTKQMDPRIKSEVSGRLTALDDGLRKLFSMPELKIDGQSFETLCCAIWMMGYSEALGDLSEQTGNHKEVGRLLKKWGIE